jgi:hypothetical protein
MSQNKQDMEEYKFAGIFNSLILVVGGGGVGKSAL